jgi:hypothetical protein
MLQDTSDPDETQDGLTLPLGPGKRRYRPCGNVQVSECATNQEVAINRTTLPAICVATFATFC